MGLFNWISKLFRKSLPSHVFKYPEPRWDRKELLRRLNLDQIEIYYSTRGFNPQKVNHLPPHLIPLGYWWHKIPKRNGKPRRLYSPNPRLKLLQRLLLRKVFARLPVHPACMGFRLGQSTCRHALLHTGKAVVVRIDIKDFFHTTTGTRIYDYFRRIGWNHDSASLIRIICSRNDRLPQGAPTSPILSNLVNYRMDARLAGLARKSNATYSRYADDLIFSFEQDNRRFIRGVIRRVGTILNESGYSINRSKLQVMRQHNRQLITGLVVNRKVQLPRSTRRWLRAIEHHLMNGKSATLNREQLAGWKAYQRMIQTHAAGN